VERLLGAIASRGLVADRNQVSRRTGRLLSSRLPQLLTAGYGPRLCENALFELILGL
jgi:hypothetical protein